MNILTSFLLAFIIPKYNRHTEDMKLLSINYLHAGAPKYWYSICPEDSQRFESYATSRFGTAASECPEFLRHKRYLISPALLKKAGIRYKTLIQRAGDIGMCTFFLAVLRMAISFSTQLYLLISPDLSFFF